VRTAGDALRTPAAGLPARTGPDWIGRVGPGRPGERTTPLVRPGRSISLPAVGVVALLAMAVSGSVLAACGVACAVLAGTMSALFVFAYGADLRAVFRAGPRRRRPGRRPRRS
jgi:hypothetical protein